MIELLDSQGNDNTVANTARVSMQFDGTWNELPEDYSNEKRDKLIKYLATHNHSSPFRHNSITVRITIPIFLARQLGKHQVGMSWNEVSRRYVADKPTFFVPDNWRTVPDGSIKQGSGNSHIHTREWEASYIQHLRRTLALYNDMLEDGVAPEMARMVLPQSMMTQVVWTGSLMAFAHVYKLRIDGHAQVEAQDFAKELDKVIRPLFPCSWSALVGG